MHHCSPSSYVRVSSVPCCVLSVYVCVYVCLPSAHLEGDLTDPVSAPRSSASEPQTVVSDSGPIRTTAGAPSRTTSLSRSPTFRLNPFNEDSDTNTSADVTPVHSRHDATTGDDTESTSTELEVIRMARRRKPAKKRRGKDSTGSVSSMHNVAPAEQQEEEEEAEQGPQLGAERGKKTEPHTGESWSASEGLEGPDGPGSDLPRRKTKEDGGDDEDPEALLRLPEMTDTSMDSVGQPLCDVMDRLNGTLDRESWERVGEEEEDERGEDKDVLGGQRGSSSTRAAAPPQQQPFRDGSGGEPPDPAVQPGPLAPSAGFLRAPPAPADFYCFTPHSPDSAATRRGHHDPAGDGQPTPLPGGHEDEGEAETEAEAAAPPPQPQPRHAHSNALEEEGEKEEEEEEEEEEEAGEGEEEEKGPEAAPVLQNGTSPDEESEEQSSPTESPHPAEFSVDNNHLLLLMIHVFRENEEQFFKMVRMSTGHMEGDLQPLYLLLTDCYIYLLRKGAAEKPYMVEEAVSYNELDYVSVGLDQQTVTLVCTNRRRQFLLDTADSSLTVWFLNTLRSAMINGCREPPYPSVLTDATMEKLALTKFVCQETHCEVNNVNIRLYSLVHWEDPLDVSVGSQPCGLPDSGSTKEGPLLYRAGTTYLGKELWKSCYLVLSNGILYQYPERTDVTPLLSITMGGEHCGGCRRSNSTERPNAFQVILTDRAPLELSADNEQDMAEWMQLLCQSVSKGVIPQGVTPSPCIPCCLVVTNRKLLTCHQDCQTSFFRSLGAAELCDVTAVCLEDDKEYCMIEFSVDREQFLPPWVLYFSGCDERDRLLEALDEAWKQVFQVCLPRKVVCEPSMQKRCGEALALIRSAWQRSDSLHRGRFQREPWC
ncbi:hypothetical protein ACEWY4_000459 [Coilia grayii]|uniref:PH domain-containing protein n=1 Tax=Coilia grayii TaxID=363190 RepID=A0ABD1KX89_9TELE